MTTKSIVTNNPRLAIDGVIATGTVHVAGDARPFALVARDRVEVLDFVAAHVHAVLGVGDDIVSGADLRAAALVAAKGHARLAGRYDTKSNRVSSLLPVAFDRRVSRYGATIATVSVAIAPYVPNLHGKAGMVATGALYVDGADDRVLFAVAAPDRDRLFDAMALEIAPLLGVDQGSVSANGLKGAATEAAVASFTPGRPSQGSGVAPAQFTAQVTVGDERATAVVDITSPVALLNTGS